MGCGLLCPVCQCHCVVPTSGEIVAVKMEKEREGFKFSMADRFVTKIQRDYYASRSDMLHPHPLYNVTSRIHSCDTCIKKSNVIPSSTSGQNKLTRLYMTV